MKCFNFGSEPQPFKRIVKRAEPCKCVILLVSRILWHKRINHCLKEWRFYFKIWSTKQKWKWVSAVYSYAFMPLLMLRGRWWYKLIIIFFSEWLTDDTKWRLKGKAVFQDGIIDGGSHHKSSHQKYYLKKVTWWEKQPFADVFQNRCS